MKPKRELGWRTTAQEREEWLSKQAESGLSVRAFCSREGIGVHHLYAWRHAARVQERTERSKPIHFAEVTAAAASGQREVAYYFPEGGWLEVAAGTDVRWLAELVQALRTPSPR